MNPHVRRSDPVAAALRARRPVVALETTLITHGLPRPQGLEAALRLEAMVIETGAVPATIGVLDGSVRVGMDRAALEQLANAEPAAKKCNLSNLAAQIASGAPGSTTVAATMAIAASCGIEVFATGGIGGVHRNESQTGDVSADLTALARYPVAVVCAGAKAILDLPRTVQALETAGVPVFGFQTDEFPAFYRRSSGLAVDRRFDEPDPLANAIRTHWNLFGTGVLVVNPIPAADELPIDSYESALAEALAEADRRGVGGRDVTPFLLDRLRERTGGASVRANLALLAHNARVAATLAGALARLADEPAIPVREG
jgi:pseudouridine-5'-phosphate glycosidase